MNELEIFTWNILPIGMLTSKIYFQTLLMMYQANQMKSILLGPTVSQFYTKLTDQHILATGKELLITIHRILWKIYFFVLNLSNTLKDLRQGFTFRNPLQKQVK